MGCTPAEVRHSCEVIDELTSNRHRYTERLSLTSGDDILANLNKLKSKALELHMTLPDYCRLLWQSNTARRTTLTRMTRSDSHKRATDAKTDWYQANEHESLAFSPTHSPGMPGSVYESLEHLHRYIVDANGDPAAVLLSCRNMLDPGLLHTLHFFRNNWNNIRNMPCTLEEAKAAATRAVRVEDKGGELINWWQELRRELNGNPNRWNVWRAVRGIRH